MATMLPARGVRQRESAVEAVTQAIRDGALAVIPTDTVYGVAADAFSPRAVKLLLGAKGRGRDKPPPVLLGDGHAFDALATRIPEWARSLAETFWPGALTLVCHAQPSLAWDLGETHGTVAVRVPDDEVARAILRSTGPLAVSSANRTGEAPAATALAAQAALGDRVALVVDGGVRGKKAPSTIVDATNARRPLILRAGAIPAARIDEVLAIHGLKLAS